VEVQTHGWAPAVESAAAQDAENCWSLISEERVQQTLRLMGQAPGCATHAGHCPTSLPTL